MIELLIHSFQLRVKEVHNLVDDLDENQLCEQPVAGMNHPAWNIGHMIFSFEALGGEMGMEGWLSDDWTECLKCGRREHFGRWKRKSGILKAVEKRPIGLEQVDAMIDEIERELFNSTEHEVNTTAVGEAVMNKLKQLDEVAYVRFASVYRQFKDLNEFMSELKGMLT